MDTTFSRKAAAAVLWLGGWLHAVAALDRSLYGIDYDTRTYEWGGCKSKVDMRQDFVVLKPLTSNIRVYSIDDVCFGRLLDVASEVDMRLWLGIWSNVNTTEDDFEPEFARLQQMVVDGRVRNDNVVGIHVASEALFRYYSRDAHDWAEEYSGVRKLFGYVSRVREFLRANDLTFPVAIADVIDSYKSVPEIYSVVDVITVNQFSQWEGGWSINGANLLFDRMQDIRLAARKAGKPILLSETGWSANGSTPDIKEASPASSATYLHDFMRLMEQQDMAYYYFTSFNLAWGQDSDTGEIERNFGLFDEHRNLLPHVKSVTLGAYHKPVRIWHQGQVVKADGPNTHSFGRVYLDAPARGLSDSLDREIWFYDQQVGSFRSRSTNQCLTASKQPGSDDGGEWGLSVSWCQPPLDDGRPASSSTQRWHVNAKQNIIEVLRPPPPVEEQEDATSSSLTCGACKNCQFANAYFSLCYVNWSRSDCKRMGADHHWCGSTGHKCLVGGRRQDDVAAGDCNVQDPAFHFHLRPLDAEELTVTSMALGRPLAATATAAGVTMELKGSIATTSTTWYYDPMFQRLRSKAIPSDCLDVVDEFGRVDTHFCDHRRSQRWSYNDLTGQLLHMGHLGRCLQAAGSVVFVDFCDLGVPTQQWTLDLIVHR
ncbi:hypothetical protein DYB38_002073 [Aphanomyces astaci]|uniref:glucan endo-1,3-beta-D-glucosidase n=2 Tax=Aphanomyces astaci TaxID=112090 RepID=A0A397CR59_APHAT|nr:hypothetical protein DYB38_002073 [Aphanomyces astaci]RHY47909.1 hypothetical protein DYB34_005050 [Aphanomyces astaci]